MRFWELLRLKREGVGAGRPGQGVLRRGPRKNFVCGLHTQCICIFLLRIYRAAMCILWGYKQNTGLSSVPSYSRSSSAHSQNYNFTTSAVLSPSPPGVNSPVQSHPPTSPVSRPARSAARGSPPVRTSVSQISAPQQNGMPTRNRDGKVKEGRRGEED